jgi:hypothetical protein
MENVFNTDFSDVKIHANSFKATEVGAIAYTQGNDIHFSSGQFKPDTTAGQWLLGHELTHVVQQREGRVQPTAKLGNGMTMNDSPALEREADEFGTRAALIKTKPDAIPVSQNTNAVANAGVQERLAEFSAERVADGVTSPHPQNYQFNNAPIQRLVGFEVEAHHLPVSAVGTNAVENVVNCLDAAPSGEFPKKSETWHKVLDTNSPLATVLNRESKLWKKKATKNKNKIDPALIAAIPEYVTEPFDEKSDETYTIPTKCPPFGDAHTVYGLGEMQKAISEIATEIADLRSHYNTLGSFRVGVPPLEDWREAATYFGIDGAEEFATESRQRVMDLVLDDKNLVQATIGILPEKITSFLAMAANQGNFKTEDINMPISAKDPAAAAIVQYKLLGGIMHQVDTKIHELVYSDLTQRPQGKLSTDSEAEKAALDGVLRFLLYATTGNTLWYIKKYNVQGIPKQMVSFFPKTPLHKMVQSLPYHVNPSRLRTLIFAGDFNSVVNKVYDVHLEIGGLIKDTLNGSYEVTDAQITGTAEGSQVGTVNVRDYLVRVLAGKSDPYHQAWAKEEIKPENPRRGGREGVQTHDWFWRNQRTRAVVIETRHAIVRLPAEQLLAFAKNISNLVIQAHR